MKRFLINPRWLIALLPLAIGIIIGTLAATDRLPDPLMYITFDLIAVAFILGVVLSLILAAWLIANHLVIQARRQGKRVAETQASADRRRLMQRLDHELKNPLTAIQAGVANISEAPTEDGRKSALSTVLSQTTRLSRLAADLRKLADLEQRPIEHAPVGIPDLLQEVMSVIQERREAPDRKINLLIPQAPWPVSEVIGDRDLLFLAIHNLVDNALKFTQPGDTIEVRAFEERSNVIIEVADTGQGIPEEELPFVWEELARGQAARGIPGSGLGLALVRAIIARHNGETSIRSREGQGTVLTVRLPSALASHASP